MLTALIERVKKQTRKRIRDDREGAPEDVAEILGVIEKGIFDRGFDLSDVRRACAPSAETLRAFRAHLGGTFKSYVTARYLEAAEQLVDVPELDLEPIAEGLGFANAELFSRWFRRWTGKTPEERREARRQTRPPETAAEPLIPLWFQARAVVLQCEEAALLTQITASSVRPARTHT